LVEHFSCILRLMVEYSTDLIGSSYIPHVPRMIMPSVFISSHMLFMVTFLSASVRKAYQIKLHHCTVSYGILHIIYTNACTVHKNCVMEGNVKTVTVYCNVLPLYCICPTYGFLHVLLWAWIEDVFICCLWHSRLFLLLCS